MISLALFALLLLVSILTIVYHSGIHRVTYISAAPPFAFGLRFTLKGNRVTAKGPRTEWHANPTKEFSRAWESSKEALNTQGYSFVKDRADQWQVAFWEKPAPPKSSVSETVPVAAVQDNPHCSEVIQYILARSSSLIQQRDGDEITWVLKAAAAASAHRVLIICSAHKKRTWLSNGAQYCPLIGVQS